MVTLQVGYESVIMLIITCKLSVLFYFYIKCVTDTVMNSDNENTFEMTL